MSNVESPIALLDGTNKFVVVEFGRILNYTTTWLEENDTSDRILVRVRIFSDENQLTTNAIVDKTYMVVSATIEETEYINFLDKG